MLTGESLPSHKVVTPAKLGAGIGDRTCMGFSGTLAVYGQGVGVVTATGDSAEIGKINALVGSVSSVKTPLLMQLEEFGRMLSIFAIILGVTTFFVAGARSDAGAREDAERRKSWLAAFRDAMTVAVALIPEGLPSVVTSA